MRYHHIPAIFFFIVFLSCKSPSWFRSSNDFADLECTVTLLSGKEKKGRLTVQFETGQNPGSTVMLKTDGKQPEKIVVDSIRCYIMGTDIYFPKEVDLESFEIPFRDNVYLPNVRNILFLRRLTKETAAIGLFELYRSKDKTADGFDHYSYFVSLHNQDRLAASNIRGSAFFPGFSEKMGSMVSDCPGLYEKIKQKKKGYALGQLSVDLKKLQVVKRIIDEYNNCK